MKTARRELRGDSAAFRGGGTRRILLSCLVFYAVLCVLVLMERMPPLVPLCSMALALLSFLLYWKDKRAARLGRWRTPENTLHLLSLAGGWPGALLGRALFRHKTAKVSFQYLLWLTVLANLAVLGWLLSPTGSGLLESLSGLTRVMETHYR